jgi:hypothetical protein
MSGYIGTQPVPQATQTRDSFTATSGQTSFATGGYTPNFLDVYLNGVKLASADYTATNGSDVVLASGAATGDILEVVAFTTFNSASSSIDDNGNATAITIDSSENVLVGTTSTDQSIAGHGFKPDGFVYHTRDGGAMLRLNRLNSDGDLMQIQKDGTTVGSVGAHSSGTYLGTADTGIYFNGGNDSIDPYNPSVPINRDNAISLGAGSRRFKDLYLSGGVYLGGTGSANKLEDYEEGTWTPTHTSGNGTGSFSDARYTKIGNTVHLYFAFSFTSGGGTLGISGFPFNANGNSVGIGREDQTNGYGVYGRINSGSSTVYLYATQASSNASAYQVSNGAIKFAITYETNS